MDDLLRAGQAQMLPEAHAPCLAAKSRIRGTNRVRLAAGLVADGAEDTDLGVNPAHEEGCPRADSAPSLRE